MSEARPVTKSPTGTRSSISPEPGSSPRSSKPSSVPAHAFANRMGWKHPWVSSFESDFNFDFDVSFEPHSSGDATYNYGPKTSGAEELPGLSAFARDEQDAIFHTYSCYARGLDAFNATYQLLDRAPRGRDEQDLPYTMSWVRLRDEYGHGSKSELEGAVGTR